MLITWRGPATALSKGIFNLLTQSSLSSMINVNSWHQNNLWMLLNYFGTPVKEPDSSKERNVTRICFCGDLDCNKFGLYLVPAIFKHSIPVSFQKIYKTFQNMYEEKRPMIKNTWAIILIVLTSRAASATSGNSFPILHRRIKIWMRRKLGQKW